MSEPNFNLAAPGRAVMDRFEVARSEFVEALVCAVNRAIEDGKSEAEFARGHIDVLRTILAEAANMADFLEDLDAAEGTLRLYLAT
jgi:hypothetical protein